MFFRLTRIVGDISFETYHGSTVSIMAQNMALQYTKFKSLLSELVPSNLSLEELIKNLKSNYYFVLFVA